MRTVNINRRQARLKTENSALEVLQQNKKIRSKDFRTQILALYVYFKTSCIKEILTEFFSPCNKCSRNMTSKYN